MQVDIIPIEKSLVLRARGNEILILDDHVSVLKGLKKSSQFIEYFRYTALINRPARKLFEAWLRKDGSLWKRVYTAIGGMDDVEVTAIDSTARQDKTIRNPEEKEVKDKKEKSPKPTKKSAAPVKEKADETPEPKKAAKKKAAKKVAEKKTATKKKTTKKKAASSKTTTAKKKTTKKKATKKVAKKKTSKKK